MLSINNAYLNVTLVDPVADRERLGTRYNTGGFIFQVTDHRVGTLLSGPTYPDSYNTFDGQGIPDAFATHLGNPDDANDPIWLGIGIGLYDKPRNQVIEFCAWEISEQPGCVRFTTSQAHLGWSLQLTRELTLANRTLKSETWLKNTGATPLPARWYPHPFFPLYEGGECCKLNLPVTMPDNPGYELAPSGFIRQKNLPWGRGFFQGLSVPQGQSVAFLQKHPKLGLVAASCSYAPAWMPIWGNKYTFSFEPYFEHSITPGGETCWSITYDF
jgi:hypothetical protein